MTRADDVERETLCLCCGLPAGDGRSLDADGEHDCSRARAIAEAEAELAHAERARRAREGALAERGLAACPQCDGRGTDVSGGGDFVRCAVCHGSGAVRVDTPPTGGASPGGVSTSTAEASAVAAGAEALAECPCCDGSEPCGECHGRGMITVGRLTTHWLARMRASADAMAAAAACYQYPWELPGAAALHGHTETLLNEASTAASEGAQLPLAVLAALGGYCSRLAPPEDDYARAERIAVALGVRMPR